jgi:hypothetical protein
MLLSAPDTFASNLQSVMSMSGATAAEEFTNIPVLATAPANPGKKVGGCLMAILGAFMLLLSFGGFSKGDYGAAFVVLLISSALLWFGFIRNLIKKA